MIGEGHSYQAARETITDLDMLLTSYGMALLGFVIYAVVVPVVANLTINHNIEGDDGVIFKGENTILPKLIDINLTFNPIHENPLGWEGEGDTWNFGGSDGANANFPYGVALQTKTEDSQTGWSDSTGQVYLTDGARQAAEDEKDAATYKAGALERMAERAAELEEETGGDYGASLAPMTF